MEADKDEEKWLPLKEGFSTLAIHAGYLPSSTAYNSVASPISLSTTFQHEHVVPPGNFEYSRTGNPTRQILETRLAVLDGGKYGFCFSSGMAGISAMLSLLKSGDHVICSDDVYGGAYRLLNESIERNHLEVDFVDLTDMSIFKSALKNNTKMVFFETPANPTLKIFDISLIAQLAHEFSKEIIVAVDNTVLTPFYQRPFELGADLVHYSLTKYMNGHTDVIMGAVIGNQDEVRDKMIHYQNTYGNVPSPFDCYLVLRGLKTLHLRMPALMENSIKIAKFLESHPKVERVLHPALKSHKQHQLAMRQSSGHSSLLAFTLREGQGSAIKFLEQLKIFRNAASFGGSESVAELPAFFSHEMVPVSQREKLGITNNFVRISTGLECANDLIQDIAQALDKC